MRPFALLFVPVLLLLGVAAQEPSQAPRPNVLWITLDDLGPDFGCYGNEVVSTPHLDALAARGLRFERCWSSAPVGTPARSSWMTGCAPQTSGSHHHRSSRALPEPLQPLTGLLRGSGYTITRLPFERQSVADFAAGKAASPGHFATVGGTSRQDFNFSRGTDLFVDWSKRNAEAPFFATIDLAASLEGEGGAAATGWAQAGGFAPQAGELTLRSYWEDTPETRKSYGTYLASVTFLDAQVGRILAWLEAEGLAENTAVVVTSDSGMAMPRHKGWCFESGLRVPLLIAVPGLDPAVRVDLASAVDLAPTTLGLCGLPRPEWMEGRDLLATGQPSRRLLFAGRDRYDEEERRVRAVRGERYTLIHEVGGTWQLHDLETDPDQLTNLVGKADLEPVESRLREALLGWTARVDAGNTYPENLAQVYPEKVRASLESRRASTTNSAQEVQAPTPELKPRLGPNVVLIVADDLGYGELGCYGQTKIATPHIDALSARGVRFAQAYSGHPVCAPSRAVLLTGIHTGRNPIRNNSPWASKQNPEGEGQEPLPEDQPNLARWMGGLGRATGGFGKWGLGGPGSVGAPENQGFDTFVGYLCQKQAHDHYPAHLWRNGERFPLSNPGFTPAARWQEAPEDPAAYAEFQGEDYAPDVLLDAALAFIDEHASTPFFLYYPSAIPHVALQAPAEAVAAYADRGWDTEPYLGQGGYLPHPTPLAAYAAMISTLDAHVGQLFERLEAQGLTEDTVVVFTSDNGHASNGGANPKFFDSGAGPIGALAREGGKLRGMKGTVYEGGIRVPMIWSWPGRFAAGTIVERPVGFQDLWPTFAEILDQPAPQGIDGVSFAGSLLEGVELQPPAPLYWEQGRKQALRVGDLKLVRKVDTQGRVEAELYDLASDPGEKTDLATTRPEDLARLVALARSLREPSKVFASPFDSGL